MPFRKYKKMLQDIANLPDEVWDRFWNLSVVTEYNKGDLIHHAGEINMHFHYICSGLVRGYYIDTKGMDITWDFYFNDDSAEPNNMIIADNATFYLQEVSNITLEVLEDCQLVTTSYQALEELTAMYPSHVEGARRKLGQRTGAYFQKRIMDQHTKTAAQRYQAFIKKHPGLLGRVKQSHIATYIGITAESLSRIKRTLPGQ